MGWAIEVIKHPVLALQLLALGLGGSPCFFFRTLLVAEWLKARHSLFLCLFIWEMQFLFEAFKVWAFLQMGKNGRKKKPSAKIVYTRMLWIISNLEFFFSNCPNKSAFQICCGLWAWFDPEIWTSPWDNSAACYFFSSALLVQLHSHSSFPAKVPDTVVGTDFLSKRECQLSWYRPWACHLHPVARIRPFLFVWPEMMHICQHHSCLCIEVINSSAGLAPFSVLDCCLSVQILWNNGLRPPLSGLIYPEFLAQL